MGPRCPHLQYLRLPPGGAAPFVLICEAFVSLKLRPTHAPSGVNVGLGTL